MGTWGTGIMDDDLALDIKAEFEDALNEGFDVPRATSKIFEAFGDLSEDEDEGPILYLVLAQLQLEKNHLLPEVRNKAMQIIENEIGLERWEEAGEEQLRERKIIYAQLQEKLKRAK